MPPVQHILMIAKYSFIKTLEGNDSKILNLNFSRIFTNRVASHIVTTKQCQRLTYLLITQTHSTIKMQMREKKRTEYVWNTTNLSPVQVW